MNKIPKCKSKNGISKQNLKLTKKYSGENKIINIKQSKIINHFDSNKILRKDSKSSIFGNTKPSTISSTSSKNSSLISNQNVIYIYIIFIYFPLYFKVYLNQKVPKKNDIIE
jgi:hypothetical protein